MARHPTYNEMILTAISNLKQPSGSSRQAIAKYVASNYEVSDTYEVYMKQALKRLVKSNVLIQTKGSGASGSFKLNHAHHATPPAPKKTKPHPKVPRARGGDTTAVSVVDPVTGEKAVAVGTEDTVETKPDTSESKSDTSESKPDTSESKEGGESETATKRSAMKKLNFDVVLAIDGKSSGASTTSDSNKKVKFQVEPTTSAPKTAAPRTRSGRKNAGTQDA